MALNLPAGWSYDETTGILSVPDGTTTISSGHGFIGNTEITKVIIPEGVTVIDLNAFNGCSSLTEIVIPEGVTRIGRSAFQGCSSITTITLPSTINSIGTSAFQECTSITEIVIPSGITSIASNAFAGFTQSHDIYYNDVRSKWNGIISNNTVGNLATVHCTDDEDYDTWKDKFETSTGDNSGTVNPDPPESTDPNVVAMTPEMLQLLVTQILGKVNERIAGRIVNVISDTSDDKHVPSALAVFNFLRTVTPGMSCQTVTGSMDSVTNPNSRIIYLQKDDEADQTWTMYLWVDDAWVSIGDTSIDLVNYWSKSDADIAELREKLLDTTGLQSITDGLDLANVLRNDDTSKAIILEWIGSTSVGNIDEATMASIIEAVLVETDKVYVKKDELTTTLEDYAKKSDLHDQPPVITEAQITAAVNGAFAATEPQT